MLDNADKLHVFSDTNKPLSLDIARQTFMFTADVETGILQGYTLAYSTAEVCVRLQTKFNIFMTSFIVYRTR